MGCLWGRLHLCLISCRPPSAGSARLCGEKLALGGNKCSAPRHVPRAWFVLGPGVHVFVPSAGLMMLRPLHVVHSVVPTASAPRTATSVVSGSQLNRLLLGLCERRGRKKDKEKTKLKNDDAKPTTGTRQVSMMQWRVQTCSPLCPAGKALAAKKSSFAAARCMGGKKAK